MMDARWFPITCSDRSVAGEVELRLDSSGLLSRNKKGIDIAISAKVPETVHCNWSLRCFASLAEVVTLLNFASAVASCFSTKACFLETMTKEDNQELNGQPVANIVLSLAAKIRDASDTLTTWVRSSQRLTRK